MSEMLSCMMKCIDEKKKRRFKFNDACVVHKKKKKKRKIKMTTEIAQQQKAHKGPHKVCM